MEKKIARINWKRGQYSDVYRSTIIDPSPLKSGQKVKVVWGKTKKEYTAVIECYPVEEEKESQASQDDLQPRRAKAKRKLIPESPPAKNPKTGKEKTEDKTKKQKTKPKKQKTKPKEKKRGKIIDAASPTTQVEHISSSDSSDSEEESRPLASLLPLGARQADTFSAHGNFSDFSDVEAEDLGSLLSKTISSVDNAANQLTQSNESAVIAELSLMRTILERLECSFARQEAKLDRLFDMMTTAQQSLPQTPQCPPQTSVQSTNFSTPFSVHAPSSLEYPPSAVVPRSREMEGFDLPPPRTSFQEVERLLDNTNAIVNDSVRLGGSTAVQMSRNDFNYAKAAHKPTAMALRLVDALFPKEVLLRSTVHGTKEYAPLDRGVIAAIKEEVLNSFAFQCRSAEDKYRMWEQCKVSIGKRCQNLRKDMQNRQN